MSAPPRPTRADRRAARRRSYHVGRVRSAMSRPGRLSHAFDYLRSMLSRVEPALASRTAERVVPALLDLARIDEPRRQEFHQARARRGGAAEGLSAAMDSLRTGLAAMDRSDAARVAWDAAELMFNAAERLAGGNDDHTQ